MIEELRIGNWINYMGAAIEVTGIMSEAHDKRVATKSGFSVSLEDIKPIELTPEILEKCGFEYANANMYCISVGTFKIYIWLGEEGSSWLDKETEDYSAELDIPRVATVHQLQNLYHALTGTDLTINI